MKTILKPIILLLLCMMVVAGCASNGNNGAASNSSQATPASVTVTDSPQEQGDDVTNIDLPPAEKKKITLRLNWKFKGEFAPFYVTRELGIFEKYGIEVDLLEGSGSVQVLQVIAQNNEDIGVTSAVEPLQGIEQGMPVKMIANYMPRSPIIILSYPDNPVHSPKDLEGKSIVSSSGSTFTSIYEKFLEFNDTDPHNVEHIMVETGARNTLFFNKEADAVAVFSTNEYPLFEKNLGVELVPLYLSDYNFDIAGLSLISNDKFIEQNPNTIKRFLAAVNEGFAYTLENPEEAAAIAKALFPETVDEEIVVEQINRTGELAYQEGKPYGWIEEDSINDMADRLLESDLINTKLPMESYLTNDFMP
ncbi:ABC transporter substrate-binding protein [Paenibacillus sp. FSL W7-1287]|uniref:ABC transporter substrate-binding protein n=1 Tax=Paenibacillus sp. FSL W7-1287 TaxID=2954538 RepID=UPI0030FC45CE